MLKKTHLILTLIVVTLLVSAFQLKSPLFRYILMRKVQVVERKLNVSILYSEANLIGIKTIEVNNLKIIHKSKHIFVDVSKILLEVSLAKVIKLNVVPVSIVIDSLSINISNNRLVEIERLDQRIDSTFNNSSSKKLTISKEKTSRLRDLGKIYYLLSEGKFYAESISFTYSNDLDSITISTSKFISEKGNFVSHLLIHDGGSNNQVQLKGNSKRERLELHYLLTSNSENISIPWVKSKMGLSISFDSLDINFRRNNFLPDSVDFVFQTRAFGLNIKHKQLSDSIVYFDSTSIFFSTLITPNCITLYYPSIISVNKLDIPFELSFTNPILPIFDLKICTERFSATSIFESLPIGLFPTLRGIKVSGDVKFDLYANINFAVPDSLTFIAKLTPINFNLISFGKVDFNELNHNFIYYKPLSDSATKEITIDSTSQVYRPLDLISPHLINAVVVSEDGSFFIHKGFDPDGFTYALARNIKERKLARGGSTITMQLVKNLFLNQNKTLSRKAEEALIVWLIETQNLVSKNRVLEIYLNIIDWGPSINGIYEASKFYFNKEPLWLDLNEAIFLASLIPRPSSYAQHFDADGNLKEYMVDFFKFIASTMFQRGMINDQDIEMFEPKVYLNGEALKLLEELKLETDSVKNHNFHPSAN